MSRPIRITINLSALQHNLKQVKMLAPKSAIVAMVKANAYGHGMLQVASALNDADALGVACIEEGEKLRQAGITKPIFLIEGLFSSDEWSRAVAGNFTLIVHHPAQIEMLEKNIAATPLKIWLKIDTGMHRLGFAPHEVKAAYDRLMQCNTVQKPIGLMTHFAESESRDTAVTQKQIELFQETTKHLTGPRSLANSGAILQWPDTHADWVRPGIMLYGVSPVSHETHHLQPVMSFNSALIAVHSLSKGDRVGYNGTWTCPEAMRIGVVACGYGDGYPRHAKNGTPMLVNGHVCPLVGRVSMDMLTVNLQTQPNAKVGDPVELWGSHLPVETVALHCEANSYELLTRMTSRAPVSYI